MEKMLSLPYYKEEWRDIAGYEGQYQVSSFGRVMNIHKDKTLQCVLNSDGYFTMKLYKNGNFKHYFVHRLVAQAFINNPDNLPTVDHINRNKIDNRIENLRWASMKMQCNNRDNELQKVTIKFLFSKPVLQYTKEGVLVAKYQSATDARNQTGVKHITDCCNGKLKTSGGYIWRYANLD